MEKEVEQALRNLARTVNDLSTDYKLVQEAQATLGDYDDVELDKLSNELYNIMTKLKNRVIAELG